MSLVKVRAQKMPSRMMDIILPPHPREMQPPKTKSSLLAKTPKDIRGHMRLLNESLSIPARK